MAKKTKEQDLNLYYLEDEKEKEKKKVKRKSKQNKKQVSKKDDTFCFDDEIIIGVTKIPDKKESNSKNNKSKNKNKTTTHKNKKNNNKREKKEKSINAKSKNLKNNTTKKTKNVKNKSLSNEEIKKRKRIIRLVKYGALSVCILTAIICTMLSPLFNIQTITIKGNEKISNDEIISLSQLKLGENTYKISKSNTILKIKQNAYIENVKIKRKLPSEIEITIEERSTSFLLEYANSYIYINNQGYILDISNEKLNLPILQGQETEDENFVIGKRLCEEDLKKLSTVLKIMSVATENEIDNLITRIDILNSQNYKLIFESEGKIAYLGDCSDLTTKILNIKKILEREKGVEGEIFLNMDYTSNPVFRQKV